jgi:hypothetical protein
MLFIRGALRAVRALQPMLRASWIACALLTGCYSVTGLQVPRTTPAGKLNVGAALGATPGVKPIDPKPTLDLALRVGLSDRVDIGLRVRAGEIDIGPKLQLVRSDVEVSVASSVLAADDEYSFASGHEVHGDVAKVPGTRTSVYVGSNLDNTVSVFGAVGLDVGAREFEQEGYHDLLLAPRVLGGVVLSPNHEVHVLIELGLLVPAGGTRTITEGGQVYQTQLGPGDTRIEISVAFLGTPYDRP